MPVPTPRSGETQDQFMNRCMHESDLPTEGNQRLAACFSQWRRRPKEGDPTARGAVRIRQSPWGDD
jgi:hypothetical protein